MRALVQMTGMWRPVVILLITVLCNRSAAATDCNSKPNDADRVICGSQELQSTDELMWNSIRRIEDFIDEKELAETVADQNRWRDRWVRSCMAATGIVTCLQAKASSRIAMLDARRARIAGDRYVGESIDVGGRPMLMKSGSPCSLAELFIGDTRIIDCIYRLEPLARYRDGTIDALAFAANGGGAAYICSNFPVYIAAVRPGLPAEVVRVPNEHGNRRDAACLSAARTPQGLRFHAAPQAGEDGWSQDWTPKDGLSPPVIDKFAPQPGTDMKTGGASLVENEQFYRALQRAAEARGGSLEALLKDYAWASEGNVMLGDPPVRFHIIDGCSGWFGPGRCSNPSNARAVYDPQADRLFFMWAKSPQVTGAGAYHHNDTPGELEKETFFPPLAEWPADVFDALKRSYCQPS